MKKHSRQVFVLASLILSIWMLPNQDARAQLGLQVDDGMTVLFGQDSISAGIKTMWMPSRGAFRSGKMTSSWSYPVIGNFSAAFGSDTQAFGDYSFATGLGTASDSYGEFSIGRYSLGGGTQAVWQSLDSVFEIGNGTGPNVNSRSNLFTVQKNGNVKIGDLPDSTQSINEKLEVDGGIVLGTNINPTPEEGTIRYNDVKKDFQGWDGECWRSLTGKTIAWESQETEKRELGINFGVSSIDIHDNYAVIGTTENGPGSGSVRVFRRYGSIWTLQSQFSVDPGIAYQEDEFGYSVSLSGECLLVGAPGHDIDFIAPGQTTPPNYVGPDAGLARIYCKQGPDWLVEGTIFGNGTFDGENPGDRFGSSVSLDGARAIVGAPQKDSGGLNLGSAYFMRKISNGSWIRQEVTASTGSSDDYFGHSVSIHGDYAIIGAPYDDDLGLSSGSAYIFYWDGTSWIEQAHLTASDGAAGDAFGVSVSIWGDYVLVGSQNFEPSAYVFKRNGSNWSEEVILSPDDVDPIDVFGYSVDLQQDQAIIGAYQDYDNGPNAGSAIVYKRYGSTWVQENKLLASDGVSGDTFGLHVSIYDEHIAVIAPGASSHVKVYFFRAK